jgi:hypothetical protein
MEDSYPEEQDEPRGHLTLSAVITRKDGTVEDLGVISEGWVEGWQAASDPS